MKRIRLFTAVLVLSITSVLLTTFVSAQRRGADIYAITNAKIIPIAGPVIEHGTIVIRDGLITAVGENVKAPADATIIDGTGLNVYPGLFDTNSTLGLAAPSPVPSPGGGGGFVQAQLRQPSAPAGPNSTQPPGLQPESMVEDSVKPGGTDIETARTNGITTVLTAPRSGIWMGQSALLNLDGDTAQQMIVRSPVAMHVGFTPLRTGGYPSSLMGVFASLRQMMLDAQRYQKAQEIYERSPRGMRRPDLDRSLAALVPVLERKLPVVMYADSEREIERALDLAQEFKLRVIIAGGREAATVANRLHDQDVPVLLSINFPKRTTSASPDADPETLRTLRMRVEAQKTAAKLATAKVRFAFQSDGLTNIADYRANIGKAIENGLSADAALRAVTLSAAEILGVNDRLGSIETGKIANLTLTRGDLFDRTGRITNVFIDGHLIEIKAAPAITPTTAAGTTPTEARPAMAGTWAINVDVSGQSLPGTIIIRQDGDSLSGSIQTQLGNSDFSGGTLSGNTFHFVSNANIQGQAVQLTIDGTINGNTMTGTVNSPFGTQTLTGTRQP